MLSRNLEQTLHRALSLASERRHEYATLEHLLLGLVDDTDAATVLRACGVDLDKLRGDLTEFLDKDLAGLATDRPGDPKPTAGFQRVVQRAAIHVQSSGHDEVSGANVLVALFSERESHAVYFLQTQDMTRLDAVNFISHGIAKAPGRSQPRSVQGSGSENAAEPEREDFFHSLYSRSQTNCLQTHVVSSESALAGLADILERTLGDPTRFDIRWLGAIHAAIFLAFYYSVLTLLRPLSGVARFALSLLALWIFADIGLLAYFNSFYTDTAAALGGLATAALAVRLLAARRITAGALVWFGAAAVLFLTSKAQHGLLGLVPAGLAFLMGRRATDGRTRTTAWLVGAALLGATAWIVAVTPAWYKSQARFNLVFSKIAKNSPSPAV